MCCSSYFAILSSGRRAKRTLDSPSGNGPGTSANELGTKYKPAAVRSRDASGTKNKPAARAETRPVADEGAPGESPSPGGRGLIGGPPGVPAHLGSWGPPPA